MGTFRSIGHNCSSAHTWHYESGRSAEQTLKSTTCRGRPLPNIRAEHDRAELTTQKSRNLVVPLHPGLVTDGSGQSKISISTTPPQRN
jgi:hypothetical protein